MKRKLKPTLPRFWKTALAATPLLALSAAAAGAQGIGVLVNGEPVRFATAGPQQVQGRVLVPVRGVLEKLGANVTWMPKTATVVATTGSMDIQLKIGDRNAIVNGRNVPLDVPAQTIAGATMVPLRFLGEALGADVKWDNAARTVLIATTGGAGTPGSGTTGNAGNVKPAAPAVSSITHNAEGWLSSGQPLRVRLEGTPGGKAAFRIPGVVEDVPMRETSPGRYEGSWVVPDPQADAKKAVQIRDAAVLASLSVNGQAAPLIQAGQTVSVDGTAPKVRDLTPERDARVNARRPVISAVFEDDGSGLNSESVRLRLDDRDVTEAASVTKGFISYTPDRLEPGRHAVALEYADKAGNKSRAQWAFTVPARGEQGIRALKANTDQRLEPGDVLRVEAAGEPGARVTFSLGTIKNVAMREAEPGQYVGEYTVRKGDDVADGRVTARMVAKDGERHTAATEQAVTVDTGRPAAPTIVTPAANGAVKSPLVIEGKAAPNAKVHVRVAYRNRVLGVLGVNGTAADVTVEADKNGNWKTEPINLSGLFGSRNVEYTVTATAVNAAGEESENATLKFKL